MKSKEENLKHILLKKRADENSLREEVKRLEDLLKEREDKVNNLFDDLNKYQAKMDLFKKNHDIYGFTSGSSSVFDNSQKIKNKLYAKIEYVTKELHDSKLALERVKVRISEKQTDLKQVFSTKKAVEIIDDRRAVSENIINEMEEESKIEELFYKPGRLKK